MAQVVWEYSQSISTMPDLRYGINISGSSYPDLNISQTFDPPIYGHIVKIFPVTPTLAAQYNKGSTSLHR